MEGGGIPLNRILERDTLYHLSIQIKGGIKIKHEFWSLSHHRPRTGLVHGETASAVDIVWLHVVKLLKLECTARYTGQPLTPVERSN